jgi:hypothetical protein
MSTLSEEARWQACMAYICNAYFNASAHPRPEDVRALLEEFSITLEAVEELVNRDVKDGL